MADLGDAGQSLNEGNFAEAAEGHGVPVQGSHSKTILVGGGAYNELLKLSREGHYKTQILWENFQIVFFND